MLNSIMSRFVLHQNLPSGWKDKLGSELDKDYFLKLSEFLEIEYQTPQRTIYPAKEHIFRALQEVEYEKVKVVILGQDPYHGPEQAMGLSFAVPNHLRPKPPSLVNIFKEVQSDLGQNMDLSVTDLLSWAQQGVLLLNTVLTVRKGEAFSHRKQGWELFTNRMIELLNERQDPIVFLLWGNPARNKKALIKNRAHFILESPHPSPLSAYQGFFGSRPFSQTNAILKKIGKTPIQWTLPNQESS
jgi:uracil-DNA glycosylase